MTDFGELKDKVKKKGFGTAFYGYVNGRPVYLSRGVREVYLGDEGNLQDVIGAVTEFENGNYGTAGDNGSKPAEGHEYGRYATEDFITAENDDTALWIHQDGKALIVFFRFER